MSKQETNVHLTKKFASAIAKLIEANYGEFVDIVEGMERDAQGNAATVKDPGYGAKRKGVTEVVDSLLRRLEEAK